MGKRNEFTELLSYAEVQDRIDDPTAAYFCGLAQTLGIRLFHNERTNELFIEWNGLRSGCYDADNPDELGGAVKMLEFMVEAHKSKQPTVEEQIQVLHGEMARLRELIEASAIAKGEMGLMDSKSWADFANELKQEAEAAGGSIEFYGRQVVCYFRCPRLKHKTIMSPILLKSPYHSGQNHRIRFALPQDTELMRRCFAYDKQIYQQLQNSAEATGGPAPEAGDEIEPEPAGGAVPGPDEP